MPEPEVVTPPIETPPAVTPTWRDTLPEDLKADASLATFKDVPSLAKSFIETKKLVGQKALGVPGPDAKPEEVAAFRKALGVPDSPAEYKVKAHEMMAHPSWNPDAQADFVKAAHAHGMTAEQVNAVIGWYGDFIGKTAKDNTRLETEAKVELRNAWGANFDTFMGAANRGITRMERAMGVEAGTLVEATKGADPAAIAKLFHHIESTFTEHGFVVGEPVAGVGVEEAAAKIGALYKELDTVPYQSQRADEIREEIIKYQTAANRARRAA